MSTTTLVTHCGAREVSREELNLIEAPPPTQTWYPVRHSTVVETVSDLLQAGGFQIQKATYAVSRQNNARMFATLDLATSLCPGVSLAVGLRNSTDQSYVELNVMLDQVMISHRAQQFLFFCAA